MKKRKGTFYRKDIKERKKLKELKAKQRKQIQRDLNSFKTQKQTATERLEKEVKKLKISKKKIKKFIMDTNAILDRKKHRDNILQLLKGRGNKILISNIVLDETRKQEHRKFPKLLSTEKSIINDLKNIFEDRIESTKITNEMKREGKELEKKHKSLGLHSPDCYILAQAKIINAGIITDDNDLIESCKAENVQVRSQRDYVYKKPKMKKKKSKKPKTIYRDESLEKIISSDNKA